jgi:hypothetical protein
MFDIRLYNADFGVFGYNKGERVFTTSLYKIVRGDTGRKEKKRGADVTAGGFFATVPKSYQGTVTEILLKNRY